MPSLLDMPDDSTQPRLAIESPAPSIAPPPPQFDENGVLLPKTPLRRFDDPDAARKLIYAKALEAVKGIQPVANKAHTLSLVSADYEDPEHYSKKDQKRAILENGTLGRRIRGVFRLTDNLTGQAVDERKVTLASIPHMTERGTFILNGTETSLANQMRLRAGTFAREKDNGEIESHLNVLPGKGVSHRLLLDPETGAVKMGISSSEIPLLPVLKAMGIPDTKIREAWGDELYAANVKYDDRKAVDKLFHKLLGNKPGAAESDLGQKSKSIAEFFGKMELDPEVTQRTLGQGYDRLTPDVYLASVKKLLAVHKGEADSDDRDGMAYQTSLSPEDMIAERLRSAGSVLRPLLWRASPKKSLSGVPAGLLSKLAAAAITNSGLGQSLEEVNLTDSLDQMTRISRLGFGGIPSLDSVPDQARSVQPSQFGFIDSLRTPESEKAGVDVRLAYMARKGEDGRIYTPFLNVRTGQKEYKSPQDIADAVLAFPGQMNTAGKTALGISNGKLGYFPKEKVDFALPAMEHGYNALSNLLPAKSASKGQRVMMGSRMYAQSLPLMNREAPLVQNGIPGEDRSFEEHYGSSVGAIRASKPGKVIAVDGDEVKVKLDDGSIETHELYNNFPLNRKSVTGDTRVWVRKPGGTLWEGEIRQYAFAEGDEVLSVDPVTKKSAWCRITAFLRHKNDKALVRVVTASQRHVDVTVDHSLVTVGDDGELAPVYPLDCVVGRTRLPVAMFPVDALTGDASDHLRGCLAGLYLAEGHLPPDREGYVMLAVKDERRTEEVLELTAALGLRAYKTGGNVCFTDHEIRSWLFDLFGSTSKAKSIHPSVLTFSREFRLGLISGYFGGDGCLWETQGSAIQVSAVSTSPRLRDGVADVLSSLGVFSTRFSAPRRHLNANWNDAFGLRVVGTHLHRLPRWFFYSDREARFRALLKPEYRSSPYEAVPVPRGARKKLYAELLSVPHFVYKTVNDGFVAKGRIAEASGVFGAWAKSDVMWDVIESITPIPHQEEVFDFSVESSEVFAVNGGLVVHNTFAHSEPVVQVGQLVKPGQLIAASNHTDKNGSVALGTNLRTAYHAYLGQNFEDAIVISRSAAEGKLKSEHMYQHGVEWDDKIKRGRNSFLALFPGKFDRKTLDTVDDDGVVKVGTKVEYGSPLVLVAREKDRAHNQISRSKGGSFGDASELWEHTSPGVVTDVSKTKNGAVVTVKAYSPMKVGDKLAGRYGDKGIVSKIVDDEEMPQDSQGRPFEILLNPLGVLTRANPSQSVEGWLGRIARLTGKPYKLQDFQDIPDLREYAEKELAKHGLKSTEDIVDPTTGRVIPGIQTGERFFMKLHHTSEAKSQGRGVGGYSSEETPARGAAGGSKRFSIMDINAALSHGALEVVRDVSAIRGQKSPERWSAFMRGMDPPEPKVPHVYEKYMAMLKAAGVNPTTTGTKTRIMAMSNKDVEQLTENREVRTSDTVDWKDGLKPIPGGLFDPATTGGHQGNRWSFIRLREPMPNPVMQDPIRHMLNLTEKQFENVLAGREKLHDKTGPDAIRSALDAIDIDRELEWARAAVKGNRKGARDIAVRRMRYLKTAQEKGLHPRDWMLDRVPVLPPRFRPVSVMQQNGRPLISDANYLYKELMDANDNLKNMHGKVDDIGDERLAVYHAFKGVTGLGDPITPKNQERQVKGVLRHVFGDSPKYGMMQRKLLGSTVDMVGRATIAPNPDLDMDQAAIPETKAWEMYKPFVTRNLVRGGVEPLRAIQLIKDKAPLAAKALQEEMSSRPIIATRAPVLHRYGVMALWPRLTKHEVLQISPMIVKGLGADYDGDAMNFHVPASDEAVREAVQKMLPSRNLFSVKDFSVHQLPINEYVGGLYAGTSGRDNRPEQTFRRVEDVLRAYNKGELDARTAVRVLEAG